MVKKKNRPISFVIIMSLLVLIIANIITLAVFMSQSGINGNLQFGSIKITANNSSWFANVGNTYSNIKPGVQLLGEDITFNTNFRLASVSKQFIAFSIVNLIKENKLRV